MSDELARRILDELEHDTEREDTLRRMVASAFEARTRVFTLIVAIVVILSAALAAWVTVLFFRTSDVRWMILYATVFNTCMLSIAIVRSFLWQLILRQRVIREIKRLELRMLELLRQPPNG
jgi:hypothetical protein